MRPSSGRKKRENKVFDPIPVNETSIQEDHEFSEELSDGGERNEIIAKTQK